jgi:hypothetical protein
MEIGLFLMTKKGFHVLENLINKNFKDKITFVCNGKDYTIQEDYSN